MSIEALEIRDPGLMTTVQDGGRYGYQRFGVPVSGALDWFAFRAANILVGNDKNAAGLEMTVLGPRVQFLAETWIAITGADLGAALDGEPVPMWETVRVMNDSILSFQGATDGIRACLAIAGGIDVPVVMGSRSTYVKGAIGGVEGRPLRAGDVLSVVPRLSEVEPVVRMLPEESRPSYGHEHRIRVVLGPQHDAFSDRGIATLFQSTYTVAIQSDRMGYRLEGPVIEHKAGADILSDGTPLGAVQVPGDGQPIILLADRGTTGGYTKIATAISADISRLAQAMPGDTLSFDAVSVDTARSILKEQVAVLDRLGAEAEQRALEVALSIVVDGEAFEVVDESDVAISTPGQMGEDERGRKETVRATVNDQTYEFEIEIRSAD